MDSSSARSGREDQQVMHAQDARQTPLHANPLLDGETAGPDYGQPGRRGPAVQRAPSDMVQIESLNGSPAGFWLGVCSPAWSSCWSGLFHRSLASSAGSRKGSAWVYGQWHPEAPSILSYDVFLGAVETRTTLTRQQVVGARGELVSQERPLMFLLENLILLCLALAVERPATDPGSSNSIPREVVQEEVSGMAKGFQMVPGSVSLTMVVEYQKGIKPVFMRVQKNLGGIGLVTEYLEGIMPVFVRVQKNLGGIGLIRGHQAGVRAGPEEGIKLVFVRVQKNLGVRIQKCVKDPKGKQAPRGLAGTQNFEFGAQFGWLPKRDGHRGDGVPGLGAGGLGVPPVEDSRTYGDYGFERPPGLDVKTQGPATSDAPGPTEAEVRPSQPEAEQDGGPRTDAATSSAAPSPIDVLITGMSQLQQVLLKQRSDVIDLEPKAVSELVKLPEYTAETGAIDFQADAEYQTLSPVRRLSVAATLTPELKEDKYKKLERKVAALVLASLPKGVRDDLVAYRVQGVHQILYRLMVIFQPGGAQDRAQLLKQLDVTESSGSPAEATAALRRWYRLLQRAADLGVTLPDESLQVRSLSVIVRRTAEQNADFKFRLALARTELQIDTRPTQENVMRNYDDFALYGYYSGIGRNCVEGATAYTGDYEYSCGGTRESGANGFLYYHPDRLKVMRVREPCEATSSFASAVSWYETRLSSTTLARLDGPEEEEALLDSGATHAFRPPSSATELDDARRVGVALATGEERSIPQNRGGTLLCESGSEGTILPMGQLVRLLGCRDLQKQIKAIRDNGSCAWTWEQHLRAAREGGDRTHVAGLLHKNPVFSTVSAEVLLGVPEGVPRGDRDGWNLLKGTPWSRAKRKALYQSDGWVVHLFSGDERSEEAKRRDAVKKSFWSEALSGDEVMVDADLTASRSMDLLQRDGIFKVLAWGALNGRVKAIIGGPPRHTFPTVAQGVPVGGPHLKETQLIVKMMLLFYMAQEGRTVLWRAGGVRTMVKPHVGYFLLEHPNKGPGGERLSFFDTPLWKAFAMDSLMGEVPCFVNEKEVILGGNMNLWHLRDARLGPEGSRDQGSIWPLELVAHAAFAVRAWVGLRNHEGFLSSLVNRSWLKDPEPLQLSKFNVREWNVGAGGYKYLLVGCYRHPKLLGTSPEEEPAKGPSAAEVVPRPDDGEDWLGEDLEAAEDEVPLVAEEHEGGVGYVDPGPPDADHERDGEIEALKELAKPLEFVSVYVAKPMRSRKKAETLKAMQELYIQLRSAGFPLGRIHMDRAREYQSSAFEHWAAARDIELSRTQGDDPSQNRTAERAVGYVKMRMRVLLAQAKELSGADDEVIKGWWAMAAETAVSQHQALAMGRKFPSAARFGSRVFTRRKGYGAGGTDLKPKWIGGVYLGPARSVPGGHMVYTDEGNLWFTTNIRQFEERDPGADGASEPENRFSMEDCLKVLESEPFVKTRKQRATAWGGNGPPPIHTTLGAYQRGPHIGVTNATGRHSALSHYLAEFMKKSSVVNCEFTSITVARDLCTDVHCDRFNMRNSTNYVLTLGEFKGGGIWQQGSNNEFADVAVETASGDVLQGHVIPVKGRVVKVDPKRLHRTMPWEGGPKWTVIAHTIGARGKLEDSDVQTLSALGFPLYAPSVNALVDLPEENPVVDAASCAKPWRHLLSEHELEEEMQSRLWTRRVLDEEEQLMQVIPKDLELDYEGVIQANQEAADGLYLREVRCVPERWDEEQWLGLCRMTEGEEESFGVETMLEELREPLRVVFTVALDEVKNYASRWSDAMHKEVKALLDAGALVPLTAEEQMKLEASGKLVVLPAKGVFTTKPPDVEKTVDDEGIPLPRGSPHFVKRKARLVICGNFQGRQAREDSYAGGCQIDSLRAMLVLAAFRGWRLASTDIRNAFILAPIKDEEDDDDGTVYGLFPPKVFQMVLVPYCYQLWRVDRALYGFRRSPRLWSRFRDRRLRDARVPCGLGHLRLRQSRADAIFWAIVYEGANGESEVRGSMNIYVDDVLYGGSEDEILLVQQWLTSEWKASDLTWATEDSVLRFLGLEIMLVKDGVSKPLSRS
ncbi:unnamed protein product [Symbiodinium sp. CCMP2592]|nr:unnamed protein product [Symbiodinium sp. CCMP2592]